MTTKKNLRFDPFVEAIRRDPKTADELTLLEGYLGKSTVDGHIRVYFDEALNDFVEVPEADILHCIPKEKTENALGGSRLWVKKSTVVTFGDPATTNRPKSSFLEGDLMTAYANMGIGGQFGPSELPNNFGIPNTWTPTCRSIGNNACITNNSPCPTLRAIECSFASAVQPSCFVTCNRPTCFATCIRPTCVVTCNRPTCFVTCARTVCTPTCFRTCRPLFCTIVQTTPGCPIQTFACTVNVGDIAGGGYNPGYAGAFDPYNTGY